MVSPIDVIDAGVPVTVQWLMEQVRVLMISDSSCHWCTKAKVLVAKIAKACMLDESEIMILNIDQYRIGKRLFNEVAALTKEDTVPQIFVDETFIGGYPELKMLYERRHIHELLRPKPAKKASRARQAIKKYATHPGFDDGTHDACGMCVAEEMQKMKLESREKDLKEKAREYMLAKSAMELAKKQLNKHHNHHGPKNKHSLSSLF